MALDLSATVSQLFASLGDAEYVKIRRTTGSVLDPVNGTKSGGTPSVLDTRGIPTKLDSKMLDDSRVQSDDNMVLLDSTVEPLMTDLIEFGGHSNIVVMIKEVNHAGVTQLWKVVIRG